MGNPFSVASYSFHGLYGVGAFSIFQYFETVRYRYNLSTADIWNNMLTSYEDKYLELVRQQLDERGLTVVNLCCDGAHLWGDSEKESAGCDAMAQNCLKAARILGAKSVRFDLGIGGKEATDEQIEYCAKKYDGYCKIVGEFGAKIGPENHWGASTNVRVMRKLFEATKEKNFGLLLHLGNWQKSDDVSPEACIANNVEFAPKAFHMHMMYEICLDGEKQLLPLKDIGYQGAWGIESHKSTNEFNNVAYQLANARRILEPCDYKMEKRPEMTEEFKSLIQKFMM